MVKILVAEDDNSLNASICRYLNACGYFTVSAYNGIEAEEKAAEEKFDIIVSDIMMPKADGFTFVANVRQINKTIPVLFITAKDDMPSKERGFNIGADDYLVKPFELGELKLRISALLRRAKIAESGKIELGGFVINEEEHSAVYNGEELPLTVKEFSLLYKLLSFPKKTFSRAALMEEFWGYDSSATSRAVDVCIAELRKKVANVTEFEITTVHGLGYKAVIK